MAKILGVILIIYASVTLICPLPFISENSVTCVGGKSSGEFINSLVFCENDGYQITLSKSQVSLDFLTELKCKKVHSESVNGITNYYFYSDKLIKKQIINGKMVNIHLAVTNNYLTIGYPIIYGSY